MLGYTHNFWDHTMTLPSKGQTKLTEDEWQEMTALKKAINQLPQSVAPEKMETFTEYLVRSLREKGG